MQYIQQTVPRRSGRWRKAIRRVTSVLGAVVVFITTYALILPAITRSAETFCGLEEHTHDPETCYARSLVCGFEEGETLYEMQTQEVLICEEQDPEHVHDENCFETAEVQVEVGTHVHTAECFDEALICGHIEHTHALQCFSNPAADTDGSAWIYRAEQALQALEPDRTDREALLEIALSQIGYAESDNNYMVQDDGVSVKGYTLYGASYGIPYADWCAAFVTWCIQRVDIDMPTGFYCPTWVQELAYKGLYYSAADYIPEPGDIVFFDWEENGVRDGECDHVGIVKEVRLDQTTGALETLVTVEGNTGGGTVRENTYQGAKLRDIYGYGLVPKPVVLEFNTEDVSESSVVWYKAAAGTYTVYAAAEAGVFPEGTELRAEFVDAADYQDAAESAVDGEPEGVQAMDISFWYDGQEVEPEGPVKVWMESVYSSAVVVHVDETGEGTVMDSETEEGYVSFVTDGFSVYLIVGTTIEKTVLASDGHNYQITVTCGPDTGIPEDAELHVSELAGEEYDDYLERTAQALGVESSALGYARLFDIKIVKDGEKIQPAAGTFVDVKIALADKDDSGASAASTQVVHFGSETELLDNTTEGQIVSFETSGFSIVAVIENDDQRIAYRFYNGTRLLATEYISPGRDLYHFGDVSGEYGESFVGWAYTQNATTPVDDGTMSTLNAHLEVGEVDSGSWQASVPELYAQLNNGTQNPWVTENDDTIDNWDDVSNLTYVNMFAVFQKAYYLRYMHMHTNGSVYVINTVQVLEDASNKVRLVDQTPTSTGEDSDQFLGWLDVATLTTYRNGLDNITVDHHIDLYEKYEGFNWLVFDSNKAAGASATYTPPQLLDSRVPTQVTQQPDDPEMKGYAFTGWNTKADGSGTWWYKTDGSVTNLFGRAISNDTLLYAQWEPSPQNYYVVFWRQLASDEVGLSDDEKSYEYIRTSTRNSVTGATVSIESADRNLSTGDFAYCTFNADKSDTASVTVNADGTTTLNVYYDRTPFTLSFQVEDYTYTQNNDGNYAKIGDTYVRLRGSGSTRYYLAYSDGTPVPYGTTVYYRSTGGPGGGGSQWNSTTDPDTGRTYYPSQSQTNALVWTPYTGGSSNRYNRSDNTSWQTIYTITALPGHDIFDDWTFTGTNGVYYDQTDTRHSWNPQDSATYTARITSMRLMPAENIVFHYYTSSNTVRTFYYYVEALDTDTDTRTFNGKQYVLKYTQPNDFNIVFYNDDFWEIEGFTREAIAKSNDARVNLNANGNMSWTTINDDYGGNNNQLYFYYTRNQYKINFISEGTHVTARSEKNDDKVYYEGSLASYGQQADGSWYYEPNNGMPGYFFDGWYLNEECSDELKFDFENATMPSHDITLYAKWSTLRTRVVLVPTPGNAQDSQVQFANNQGLKFRLDYGEKISDANIDTAHAIRNGYKLVGWYTDPAFMQLWDFDAPVTNTTPGVNPNYHSTSDWANNVYGDNDGEHDNVTCILKLYAKWALDVDTTKVYVKYLVPSEYLTYDLNGFQQTTVPVDPTEYSSESASMLVNILGEPTDYANGFSFAGWQLLNPDGTPAGAPFTASGNQFIENFPSYITTETVTDSEGNTAEIKVVYLRAKFTPAVGGTTTQIIFNGNFYAGDENYAGFTNDSLKQHQIEQAYLINQDALIIPDDDSFAIFKGLEKQEGFALVGWSFDPSVTAAQAEAILSGTEASIISGNNNVLTKLDIFEPGSIAYADDQERLGDGLSGLNGTNNTLYAIWKRMLPIRITKLWSSSGLTGPLEGAEFTVYEDAACTTAVTSKVSGSDGEFTIYLKDVGTYYMKETVTPSGYVTNDTLYTINVTSIGISVSSSEGDVYTISAEDALSGTQGSYKIDNTPEPGNTTDITLYKIDADTNAALSGAKFKLCFVQSSGVEALVSDIDFGPNTSVSISGLPPGTYRLTEVDAPAGYIILNSTAEFVITKSGSDFILVQSGAANSDNVIDSTNRTVTVKNHVGVELPATGGKGTNFLYLLGGLLILGTAVLLMTRRRLIAK